MAQRNEKEFLQFMTEHKGILLKISRMYRNDVEDQADLQQEMLVHLWKSYQSFKGESKFSTWMYRVCINVAITSLRKDKRLPKFETMQELHDRADVPTGQDDELKMKVFYKAVQEISEIEKALIFLFMEGQSHREIAQQLGISEGNARVKLNRTKHKLQEIVKKYEHEF